MLSHVLCAFVNPVCESIPSTQSAIHSSGSWPLRRAGQWNMHEKAPHLSLLKCFAFLPQSVKDWCRQRSVAQAGEVLEGARSFSCDGLASSRLNLGPVRGTATPRMSWVASPQNNIGAWSNTSLMLRVQMCVSMSEWKVSLTEHKHGCWLLSYICVTLMMLLYKAVMYVTTVKGTRLSDSNRFTLHNNNHK